MQIPLLYFQVICTFWRSEYTRDLQVPELNLARAGASAAKRRCESDNCPRLIFRFIIAGWEAKPQSDVDEAVRVVDEAAQARRSVRAEAVAAREVEHRCVQRPPPS